MTSSILSISCQLKNVPLIAEIDKMNNQKLSSSFDDKNRSRSVSPEITKFEEPGMFVLLDEEILANRKGCQLGSSTRDIHPKAINLPNVGVVILHQEDPKMKIEESNGETKLLTRSETQVKDMAGNTETKSHLPNPFHVTQRQEDKLQNFKEVLSVSSFMNSLTENKMVEINSSRPRGRPKKRNGSNSKLQPTKKGDSNSISKRSTRNIQPAELGAAPSMRTRTSAVKPAVALEWSNIEIKFRVVGQDFYDLYPLYDLYPDVDPQSSSYQEDTRKNANSE